MMTVATVTLLSELSKVEVSKIDRAKIGQASSHAFIGVPCGIMDQLISSTGKEGHATLIDCRSLSLEYVPMVDDNVVVVVCNSNVKHELEGSEYSTRKQQCETAVEAIKKRHPKNDKITHLRDCTMDQLDACKGDISEVVYKRAHHVLSEDVRTLACVKALKSGDYFTAGKKMSECHVSLRDDYEVSCLELDVLVEIASGIPGVYGSRMMGGVRIRPSLWLRVDHDCTDTQGECLFICMT